MLRPLLVLFALTAVPGAVGQTFFSADTDFDISACPITYFGQTYNRVYATFTEDHLVICFDGFYDNAISKECVIGPQPDPETYFDIVDQSRVLQILIQNDLPTIRAHLNCYVIFGLGNNYAIFLVDFGQEAVLGFNSNAQGTTLTNVTLNGITVHTLSVTNTMSNGQLYRFVDVSGCRHRGVVYETGTTTYDPEFCETVYCNATAFLHVTTCGPMEMCHNGTCVYITTTTSPPTTTTTMSTTSTTMSTTSTTMSTTSTTMSTTPTTMSTTPPTTTPPLPSHSICTVTGPTVIDFSSHLDSVKDRCDYYLLKVQGLSVVGYFLERRLQDVSFLDSVTLEVNGVHIHLKQGGRVLVDGTPLNLDSSPQTVNGVQLSKDQTGVTVIVQIGNLKIIIFFDGYTVLIFVEGSTGSSLQGLCQDSSSDAKLPDCSSISCQTQYNDTDDRYIHCINKTESCNLLKEAPFTSCPIDPEPYITACTDTLSTYPAVDALKCQFLKAYVKACSLYSDITLDGWGSKTECSSKAFCQDRTCSFHEFCGEGSHYGDTRCFCRADFASCYRHCFGEPTVCRQNNAYLTLAICLLEDRGIKYSALHLNDPTCTGQVDQQNHMVTFSFNSSNCGTEIMTNGSQIIYRNTIMTQNFTSDMIIRHDDVMIDFSCYHVQPDIKTVSFTVVDSDVSKALTAGPWTYTVSMKAYVDNECTKPVERYHNLRLNQKVWVKLDTDGLDGNVIAVVIDACWATNQPSATATKKYYLIENGCPNPADPTVMIKGNGEGTTSYFSFNMFRFSGGSNEIHLHCSLHLCLKEEGNCVKTCGLGRRRRSASSTYKSDSFISMGWTH